MDHYVENAIERLEKAITTCRDGQIVTPEVLDKLRNHADFAVNFLSEHSADDCLGQKEMVPQFPLGFANLHEYLSHSAPLVGRPR